MFFIDGNDITLTRGDTLYIQITILQNGEEYVPQEGDSVRFAMKRRFNDDDSKILINKTIDIETLLLKLEPEDTKKLRFGRSYVYDVELTNSNGDVSTFIKGKLTLGEEVL